MARDELPRLQPAWWCISCVLLSDAPDLAGPPSQGSDCSDKAWAAERCNGVSPIPDHRGGLTAIRRCNLDTSTPGQGYRESKLPQTYRVQQSGSLTSSKSRGVPAPNTLTRRSILLSSTTLRVIPFILPRLLQWRSILFRHWWGLMAQAFVGVLVPQGLPSSPIVPTTISPSGWGFCEISDAVHNP